MKLKLFSILVACAIITGAGMAPPASVAHAQTSGSAYMEPEGAGTYKSEYFGLSLKAPSSWALASKAEADAILNTGSEMVAGDDKEKKAAMDASVASSLPILFLSRFAMSEGRGDNSNISAIAENVAAYPMIKTGADYFDNMKLAAVGSATPISFAGTYETKVLDGVSFTSMSASINLQNITVKQEYLATRRGDHVISFIASYSKDEEKFLLDGILSTIAFD